eukprot:8675133-Pyramimonas_sp.AAC.1
MQCIASLVSKLCDLSCRLPSNLFRYYAEPQYHAAPVPGYVAMHNAQKAYRTRIDTTPTHSASSHTTSQHEDHPLRRW